MFREGSAFLRAVTINQAADHGEKPGHPFALVKEGVDVLHRFG